MVDPETQAKQDRLNAITDLSCVLARMLVIGETYMDHVPMKLAADFHRATIMVANVTRYLEDKT